MKESNFVINSKVKLNRKQLLVFYFALFAFFGWVLETVYCLFVLGHFTKRGFLYGPLCPIYGWGALLLITFLAKYKKNNLKLFVYSAFVFSAFEYVVSYILDALFAMHWWDYTGEFMNLNGRISIFYSFAWGIIAILFINHLYPFVKKKLNYLLSKIPYKVQIIMVYLLIISISFDTIASTFRYFFR